MSDKDILPVKPLAKRQMAACNEFLTQQALVAWDDANQVKVPASYKNVQNIVFVGMGGSSLGAHIMKCVFDQELTVPFELVRDYKLPGFVNEKTLVVLSSFSGTTEEVLFAAKEAKKKKAKILVMATGGKLGSFAKREEIPGYIFEPGDLAPQPRLGLGFSLVGAMALMNRIGLLSIEKKQIEKFKEAMDDVIDTCALDVHTKSNPAKKVAHALAGKPVMIVAAEHLVGNAHVMQNQINETAKQYTVFAELPELNHHLLEGLTYPEGLFGQFVVVMLKSKFYNKRVQQRFEVTAELFERQGSTVVDYDAGGGSRLEEVGELLQFSAYVSCYLSMLNSVDPLEIPWVDQLKKKMAKK